MFVFVQILATMANVGDLIADMKNLSPDDQQKLADVLKAKMPDTTITSTDYSPSLVRQVRVR